MTCDEFRQLGPKIGRLFTIIDMGILPDDSIIRKLLGYKRDLLMGHLESCSHCQEFLSDKFSKAPAFDTPQEQEAFNRAKKSLATITKGKA